MNWSDIPSRHPRTLHVANLDSSDYVSACKARGYTSVRLLWVKKAEVSA